ncbi:hypothetical protein A3860_36360 [Niastella vici]|uniref:Uncharacterized protein n=1 Tax=Niastella vici TaxID=1703345 RepID=A0A1V9FN21_9BACT|nr:hypothetical protein A3860_36360 [Niastella vici]
MPINKMNVDTIKRQHTMPVKTNKVGLTMPVERGINLNSLYNKITCSRIIIAHSIFLTWSSLFIWMIVSASSIFNPLPG